MFLGGGIEVRIDGELLGILGTFLSNGTSLADGTY